MTAARRVILDVREKLEPHQEKMWFSFIRQLAGGGERIAESSERRNSCWRYESRGFPRLDPETMDGVIMMWCEICGADFDVQCSVDPAPAACYRDGECGLEMDAGAMEAISAEASTFRHNRWVDGQIAAGWRFGMAFDEKAKTDPNLRDWHSLPEDRREKWDMEPAEALAFVGEHPSLFAGRM